jgi:hypothetical protein
MLIDTLSQVFQRGSEVILGFKRVYVGVHARPGWLLITDQNLRQIV